MSLLKPEAENIIQLEDAIEQEEIDAGSFVSMRMAEFTKDQQKHILPDSRDGLMSVTRRFLWQCYAYSNKLTGFLNIIPDTAKLHNHGDTSIRNSIDVHMQPWKTPITLLFTDGNKGTYSGDNAAASRYLRGYVSDIAMDIYFNRINKKVIPMEDAEVGEGVEPIHLIPIIPAGLVNNDKTITPGHKFVNIPININDMCELTRDYIGYKSKGHEYPLKRRSVTDKLVKYLLPDIPAAGLLRNFKLLMKEYKDGNFNYPVVIDGVLEISPNSIVINTIHSYSLANRRKLIELKEMVDNNSFFSKNFSEFADMADKNSIYGKHTFSMKRGVEPFVVLDQLKAFYGFTTSIRPFRNFLNRYRQRQDMSQFDILEAWYEVRYKSVIHQLKLEQIAAINNVRRLKALIVALRHSKQIFEIFDTSESLDSALRSIVMAFPELTMYQAQYLGDIKHKELTKHSRQSLMEEIEKAEKDLLDINNKLSNIDSLILDEVNFFQKKYCKQNKTKTFFKGVDLGKSERFIKVPNFICVCQIRDIGYQQCFDWEEVNDCIVINQSKVEVLMYPNKDVYKYMIDLNRERVIDDVDLDLPQIFAASKFEYADKPLLNTVVLTANKKVFLKKGLIRNTELDSKYYYIGNKYRAFYRDGSISVENFEVSDRRLITDIIHISNHTDEHCIVVYISPVKAGYVCMEKLTSDKLNYFDVKTTEILYAGYDDDVFLSIPKHCISKLKDKYLLIKNIKGLFKDRSKIDFTLGKYDFKNVEYKKSNIRHINVLEIV